MGMLWVFLGGIVVGVIGCYVAIWLMAFYDWHCFWRAHGW